MKAIAEFAMRGRFQALFVAFVCAGSVFLCWISAAIVALATLRKGAGQGGWLLLWSLLPAFVLVLWVNESGPLLLLLGTTVLALVLRNTVSLPLTVLSSVPVGVLTALAMLLFGQPLLAEIAGFFDDFLQQLEAQMAANQGQVVDLPRPTSLQIAGLLGVANAVISTACLLLARWWQAVLYNPGGFGREFRALSFSPVVTTVLCVAAIVLATMGSEYFSWAGICIIPLNFAGIALVHAWVLAGKRSAGWLVGFYLALLLIEAARLLLVVLAIADSLFQFRRRWKQTGSEG
ncbi:MAG: hypothetical protein ACK5ME_00485 [Parahaliea sp.]